MPTEKIEPELPEAVERAIDNLTTFHGKTELRRQIAAALEEAKAYQHNLDCDGKGGKCPATDVLLSRAAALRKGE